MQDFIVLCQTPRTLYIFHADTNTNHETMYHSMDKSALISTYNSTNGQTGGCANDNSRIQFRKLKLGVRFTTYEEHLLMIFKHCESLLLFLSTESPLVEGTLMQQMV